MGTRHSDKHSGLQQHSLGDLYPWSVAVRDSNADGVRCVPFHALNNTWGPEFRAADNGFAAAHRSAESWIERNGRIVQSLGYRDSNAKALAENPQGAANLIAELRERIEPQASLAATVGKAIIGLPLSQRISVLAAIDGITSQQRAAILAA